MEKPDVRIAAEWIEAENCYWNSGMFVFAAGTLLRELDNHAASICRSVEMGSQERGAGSRIPATG